MLGKLSPISSISPTSFRIFQVFGWLTLVCILIGIATDWYFLAGIPALGLLVYLTIVDFRKIYFLLLFCIPLSTDISLPGGLATNLPTEPLMIGLMGVSLLILLKKYRELDGRFFLHPLTLLLVLHLSWMLVTCVTSGELMVSVKFLLAKMWYVTTFYFLTAYLIKTEKDVIRVFWTVLIPLIITVLWVIINHSSYGFSFSSSNKVLYPFYPNHVIYASILALFFPFIWFMQKRYTAFSGKWFFLLLSLTIIFVAIQLSYTRAAIASIFIAIGAYYVVRLRLVKLASALSLVAALALIIHLASNDRYLDYAPNFERTITHKNFDNLLEATAKGEDISTMERLYRRVAGAYMIQDQPWLGFGPGNFYNFYKSYTVSSFRTYVSDNQERSGIHNYYLMIWVEQGVIGFFIFLLFTFWTLIKGEEIYHQCKTTERRRIVMMVLLSIIIIDVLLLINDMIESDKVGSFYFICIAILVNMDLANWDDSLVVTEEK